jgi:preprotein translocase subunit SecD
MKSTNFKMAEYRDQKSPSSQPGAYLSIAIALSMLAAGAIVGLDRSTALAAPRCLRVMVEPKSSKANISDSDFNLAQEKIVKRIQGLGIATGTTQLTKNRKILIQLSHNSDPHQIVRTLSTRGEVEFRIQKPGTKEKLAVVMADLDALEQKRKTIEVATNPQVWETGMQRQYLRVRQLFSAKVMGSGSIQSATVQSASRGGSSQVLVKFTETGKTEFAKLTKAIAGSGRSLGIFLDGKPISMPIINESYQNKGIEGGVATIEMGDRDAATDLAAKIHSGAFPFALEVVSQGLYSNCPVLKSSQD